MKNNTPLNASINQWQITWCDRPIWKPSESNSCDRAILNILYDYIIIGIYNFNKKLQAVVGIIHGKTMHTTWEMFVVYAERVNNIWSYISFEATHFVLPFNRCAKYRISYLNRFCVFEAKKKAHHLNFYKSQNAHEFM